MTLKLIADIMTKGVISITPEASLHEAVLLMTQKHISSVVIAKESRPLGIISERTLVQFLSLGNDETPPAIKDIMQPAPLLVNDGTMDYLEAYQRLKECGSRCLVIVDSDGLISGIITVTDLINQIGLEVFAEEKPISKIMTPNPIVMKPSSSMVDVAASMVDNIISCIIIVEDHRPVGIITERDVVNKLEYGKSCSDMKAENIMSSPVEVVPLEARASDIIQQMKDNDFRHLVVVNDGLIAGVVTETDIVNGIESIYVKNLIHILDESIDKKTNRLTKEIKMHEQARAKLHELTQSLKDSEMLYRAIFENSFDAIVIHIDGQIVFVNKTAVDLSGMETKQQLIGTHVLDNIHHDDLDVAVEQLRKIAVGRVPLSPAVLRYKGPNGDYVFVEFSSQKIIYEGKPACITFGRDITDRTKAKEEVNKAKNELEKFFALVPDLICVATLDGYFKRLNAAWEGVLGYSIEEMLGKPFTDFIHPDDIALTIAEVEEQIKGGHTINFVNRYRCKDNTYRWLEWVAAPAENKTFLYAAARDITDRVLGEEKIRILSSSVEQAGESIMITDRKGVIEYANPAFSRITGYSVEEAIGKTPGILKSGNQDTTFYKDMWRTITSGEVWHGKVVNRKKDGSLHSTMLTISPVLDQSGDKATYSHFVGIQSDLTEIENLEHQFYQAQKMEAVGTLVGGIAHDFNNMLAGMIGNLYLAKKKVREQPDVVKKLDNIEGIAFQAAEMVRQLLTFARKSMVNIKPIPLIPFVKEALKLLHLAVPENIKMHQYICSETMQINGDVTQLNQILMNLVQNACDALEAVDDPYIIIRLDIFHAEGIFIESHSYFTAGLYAHLSIADNGCGIPEHQIGHLFEPFFTTKEPGKGTGLGLAMVFGAIKTHQGFVEVESTEGKGSTFHIYIPLLQTEAVELAPAKEKKVSIGHGELILLVDDDLQIIDTGKEVLESLGYRVLTAANGREAIEIFEAHIEEVGLCIFDIVMPTMSGSDAALFIRQIKPCIKIIFSTGYDKNMLDGIKHETVVTKPFCMEEISWLIREKLDS